MSGGGSRLAEGTVKSIWATVGEGRGHCQMGMDSSSSGSQAAQAESREHSSSDLRGLLIVLEDTV